MQKNLQTLINIQTVFKLHSSTWQHTITKRLEATDLKDERRRSRVKFVLICLGHYECPEYIFSTYIIVLKIIELFTNPKMCILF